VYISILYNLLSLICSASFNILSFRFIPALLILLVDLGDFLDGVVARYWLEINSKERLEKKPKPQITDGTVSDSSDEGFHVVSTGSSQSILSWTVSQRLKKLWRFHRCCHGYVTTVILLVPLFSTLFSTRILI